MSFVLIASSDTETKDDLRTILGNGYHVVFAKTGNEAIGKAVELTPDIIFLDTTLEDYRGLTLVGKISDLQINSSIVVIASADQSLPVEDIQDLGNVEILFRPITRQNVEIIMGKALERKQLITTLNYLKQKIDHSTESVERPFSDLNYQVLNGMVDPQSTIMKNQYALRELYKALTPIENLDRLLEYILNAVSNLFSVNKASIMLLDAAKDHYAIKASIGLDDTTRDSVRFKAHEGCPLWFRKHNQILRRDAYFSNHSYSGLLRLHDEMDKVHAVISAPLLSKGQLIGILHLGNKVTGRPFYDSDLELIYMISHYAAISIHNSLLYNEIAFQKKHNENILQNISSGVITVDKTGVVRTYNRSAEIIMGIPTNEILGKPVQKLGSMFADILLRTLEDREPFRRHEVFHPVKKSPIGISTSLLLEENEEIKGAIMVFSDLTEIKELEKKNRTIERLHFWSRLSNRLAQEIRNPLVAIKTFAQLLPSRYMEEEFRQSFYEIVSSEVDRLSKIASKLIEFAEPQENRFEEIDINAIIDEAVLLHEAKLIEKKVNIYKKLEDRPLVAMADKKQLLLAISNLIENSIDALPDGGKLRIRSKFHFHDDGEESEGVIREGEFNIQIEVEDTGCGIPNENLKDIFSPFFSTKVSGMGFGLPIAQRIIHEHNGNIEVISKIGKGSKFRIFLPGLKREVA